MLCIVFYNTYFWKSAIVMISVENDFKKIESRTVKLRKKVF